MKNPYFLQKIKVKNLKCCLLQYLFGALRVNLEFSGLSWRETNLSYSRINTVTRA